MCIFVAHRAYKVYKSCELYNLPDIYNLYELCI